MSVEFSNSVHGNTVGGSFQLSTLARIIVLRAHLFANLYKSFNRKQFLASISSKMSVPALRQPKNSHVEVKDSPPAPNVEPQNFLIVTLKDGKKLVVSSDSYHGLLTAGELFRCVFCETEMVRDVICKERHKTSENHRKILESYPHVEEFKENLIRKLNGADHYCTVCNVVVTSYFLHKHMTAEAHIKELQMALARARAYKPFN